ncbi:DUF1190 domain-containing protein [Pseudogemmobacter faecipullorum]|uniref:DUF1190 domain-containing protein n=1 Tax=Pseudogemmobacter faecipullorum TaxID=2755041 RepID=A0ABS8CK14_9RHOB|nr:DUF1190 domain-containing protein [Pseudogemmobacter faecipullorum]MCB5409513.1 DUF1190 domain-containing protein [Pseudogemmobacter faecipullorum]
MTKRSKHVALAILGATAFALAGCQESEVEAQAFPDLQSCKEAASLAGYVTAGECETAFAEAEALHAESAPRYDSLAVCEAEHGAGNCGDGPAAQSGGGGVGSIFMPLMMGYLMGSMMGGGGLGRGAAASQPMYKTADGKFTNAAGTASYGANSGRAKVPSSQFARPASTVNKPPMSAAPSASRGGFGGSSSGAGG